MASLLSETVQKKYTIPLIKIETDESGCHIAVKVVFSEQYHGIFIIDTGASRSFISKKLDIFCSELESDHQLVPTGIESEITGSISGILKILPFEKISIPYVPVILIDLDNLNKAYAELSDNEILGLLGGDFLNKHSAVLNYQNSSLILSTKNA